MANVRGIPKTICHTFSLYNNQYIWQLYTLTMRPYAVAKIVKQGPKMMFALDLFPRTLQSEYSHTFNLYDRQFIRQLYKLNPKLILYTTANIVRQESKSTVGIAGSYTN